MIEPGDILVGKITAPRRKPDDAEEKLAAAHLGEKASDVREYIAACEAGDFVSRRSCASLTVTRRKRRTWRCQIEREKSQTSGVTARFELVSDANLRASAVYDHGKNCVKGPKAQV